MRKKKETVFLEVHVPLGTTSDTDWIDQVQDYISEQSEHRPLDLFDDGEEYDDFYVFFIEGDSRQTLVEVAEEVARLSFVPSGAYAVYKASNSRDLAAGERIALSGEAEG